MPTKTKKPDLCVSNYKREEMGRDVFDTGEDTSCIQGCDNKGCGFYKKGKCEAFGTQCFGYIEPYEKRPN